MVPYLEAQKEIQLSGLYSQGAEDFPLRARFGTERKNIKRRKPVKFNFLFSVTGNVFLQILTLKSGYNLFSHVCVLHDICLLGDALFTVQLFLIAMASGRSETDDQR